MTAVPPITEHFATLASGYDVVLSDVWGIVHNGVAAHAPAGDALSRFRHAGGTVVLISNAPRPGRAVISQLDLLGVLRAAYDDIVTSGDVTHAYIAAHPGRASSILALSAISRFSTGSTCALRRFESADYVVCTGLFDDTVETPETYRELMTKVRARGLLMVCGNPDVVVERGDKLVYCAGAIADLYGTLGGEVIYAGKPHRPIYDARSPRPPPRAAPRPRPNASSRSAIRCVPISPAPPNSGSIACSSPPVSMPKNWADGTIRIRPRWRTSSRPPA